MKLKKIKKQDIKNKIEKIMFFGILIQLCFVILIGVITLINNKWYNFFIYGLVVMFFIVTILISVFIKQLR